jgi:gliding motility-associated lipoprotein GldH
VFLVACDTHRKFDAYKSIESLSWEKDMIVNFQFEIKDTLSKNNLFINIRNTNEYGYNNLFLITNLQYPNGFHVIDTLEYEMTDEQGNWLGQGFTDIKESKLFFKNNFVFPTAGNYQIGIQQAMRKRNEIDGIQTLMGISDVGFRVEESNE